jgi:FAD/FMN-containing dehydrogenase/pimeloyl-ACP methyl ester carboxylesterase
MRSGPGGRTVAAMTTLGTTIDAQRGRLLAGIPVTERRLQLDGVSTAVFEGGEGPPVVLLHGPAGNAAHWAWTLPGLLEDHRVIAPDLPDQGTSESADGPLDAERVLAWLGALIDETCSSPPALVGYGLGGAIAARFAAARPGLLSRLVLVDSLGLVPFEPAPEFGDALHAFLGSPAGATHTALWRQCALDLDRLRADMADRWEAFEACNLELIRTPRVAAGLGALMEQFGGPPIPADQLNRIDVPTTLIWGRHDLATPLAVAEAAGARHDWPLRVIEDCADDPPVEQPGPFLRALRAALVDAEELAGSGFGGEVVDRGHARYDELRQVYNGLIDRRPALIARCANAADVSATIRFAREHDLPLSVYGGGHNVTGNAVCDDGVTIDLRPIKGIAVDPAARTCRAEAGLTWGELDAATQEHGLAVTGGRVSTTGLAGLALGGGSGWIERAYGYTVDNLLAVELVTADGDLVRASESENPDLFWGTRGGGGNLGVATAFELRLHPIGPTVLGGLLMYPAPMAADVLRNFRKVMAAAPDEVGSGVCLLTAPHEEFVPEPVRGKPVVGVVLCYAGPPEEGEDALRPLREFGPPALDAVGPMPYVALQQLIDPAYPAGLRNYWTGDFLSGLPDEAIDVMCRFHLTAPSPLTQILTLPGGGVSARVPDGTMAIAERGAPFNIHITSLWPDVADDEANIAWTRELSAAMKPFTTGRVYVNFIGDEGRERVVAAFGPQGYARLQELKQRWDPHNIFRTSQNVRPPGA